MASRITHLPHTVYEVRAYVVAREMLYREVWNALEYLQLLEDGCRKHNCLLHAWCLMPHQAHLMVSSLDIGSIPAMMGYVQIRHTRRMNSLYDRRGPLWDGPYESRPVSPEDLAEALRELYCEPSMAGLCPTPDHFEWSDLNPRLAHLSQPWPLDYRNLSDGEKVAHALGSIRMGRVQRN